MPISPEKTSDSDISEPNSPRVKSELELLREKNIRERDAYLASLMKDPEFADIMGSIGSLTNNPRKSRLRKSNGNSDPTFRSHALIPLERRRSARLENKSPIFTKDDLIDESTFKRKRYADDGYSDLEDIVYEPQRSQPVKRSLQYTPSVKAEDVTERMINNIARKVSAKVYSEQGTCCHQCRQKTIDQKTCCRSKSCVGKRGQFCGVCLENRYGEDAAVALKDPDWHCPVCRNICNCSFCRAKAGKRPTGILTPQALQAGHKSVKDFLDSLKGEGDYPHMDKFWKNIKNPKYLLGFSKDLTVAHMGGGIEHKMEHNMNLEKLEIYIQKEEEKLNYSKECHDKIYDFLGFANSGNEQMNNNIQYEMQESVYLKHFENFINQKQGELEVLKENFLKGTFV